jgi:hypothetical protein
MEKLIIESYQSTKREVTKEEYKSHLEQNISFRYGEMMRAKMKVKKALKNLDETNVKLKKEIDELGKLFGYDEVNKTLEYREWAFKEMNPSFMRKLQE